MKRHQQKTPEKVRLVKWEENQAGVVSWKLCENLSYGEEARLMEDPIPISAAYIFCKDTMNDYIFS